GRVPCTDIEDAGLLIPRKGIHPHCEHRELSGASRRFEQSARVRIESRRQRSRELAYSACVSVVRTTAGKPRCAADLEFPALELPERLLGHFTQPHVQMVYQGDYAALT